MSERPVSLRLAEASYRLALRFYPRTFRDRFGQELTRTFRDGARGALDRRGPLGLAGYWVRCVSDAGVEGVRGRLGGGFALLSDIARRDLRDAWRGLRRRPTTSAVALLTLTLGVGANAAIFSVVHGVVLRPFPYADAEKLVVLRDRSVDGGRPFRTTGGAYRTWREETR